LGYVTEFADKPGLEKAGWLLRLKLMMYYIMRIGDKTFMKKIIVVG
jgi:hypothetical protein